MPPEDTPAPPTDQSQPAAREPLSTAKQKRLQQCFSHASKQMAQENYDYATTLFAQCVEGDPSNLSYVQSFLANLQKKYNNNKTGSKLAQFKERGARSAIKKALSQSKWDDVIKHGLKVLAVNPWDIPTLTSMATSADKAGDDECELYYLKCALDANSKDPDVNRQCAMALATRQQFDQAIACWHRVEQARPDDDEAQRAIASLAVEKTIVHGKYEDKDAAKFAGNRRGQPHAPECELTMQEMLEGKIKNNPEELSNYFELAQLHINSEDYQAAEDVYARALEVSDGAPDVRERWEDVQVRHLRQQITQTEDEETKKKLREEYNQKELAIHKARAERYPNNLSFKYDLGLRYQVNKQYNEAIKEFQQARNDPRRKGVCLLALGQCFQQIKQYRLAMSHYESAVEEIPDRDAKNKKEALRLAGKLAMALKDVDAAEIHLTALAGLDFTYKDVSALLDKVDELRENGDSSA